MPYNIYGAAIENNIGALSTPQAPPPHIKVWENKKKCKKMKIVKYFFPPNCGSVVSE